MTAKKFPGDPYGFRWYFQVWGSDDLGYLHLLGCRVQQMGRIPMIIDQTPGQTENKDYMLWASFKLRELGWRGPSVDTNSGNLLGITKNRKSTDKWDWFWSRTPHDHNEEAWVKHRPLYNE